MSTSTLPGGDSPDLYLVEATPQELETQQLAHFTAWGGALSLEAYMRRERHLFAQELTRDGALTQWVLVHQPAASATRQVLCGCESVKKRALVRRDGEVREGIAFGIGSVFCPPQFRGKGYAGRMMTELGKRLRSWQATEETEVLFSVLFSDIGKQFYAARGWETFPSAHVTLSATKKIAASDLPAARPLHADDLAELCSVDEQLIHQRIAHLEGDRRFPVALLPDHHTIIWHHAREEFVATELFQRHPVIKGAVVGEPGSRVWCYWTRVWTNPQEAAPDTLHILRLGIEDETFDDFVSATEEAVAKVHRSSSTVQAIAALFAAAQAEAAEWNLDEVLLWNPSSTSLAAARLLDGAAQVVDREDESITSLLWYGEGSHRDVEWVCNEKFGWC